jgi:CBS domain containing-hemolysin-like protein
VEADGTTTVDQVEDLLGESLPEGHAVTLAGRLVERVGRMPVAGERFRMGGLEIDVLRASPVRVERLVIRRQPAATITLDTAAR